MPRESILKIIADNDLLFNELKDLFLAQFTLEDIRPTSNNEELGQMVRARLEGRILIEKAFAELKRFKTFEGDKEDKNPAR